MRFSSPLALILLVAVPYFIWLGRPRRATARWREWASLGLRLLIALLLILGLAGVQVVRSADDLAVVFLVDASDSITPVEAVAAEALVRQAIARLGPSDQAAVVVFGANALVERPMSGLPELASFTSVPQTLHTDIDEAIRLGLALFPAGSARRLVLISDGAATQGEAEEAARLAAASGVPIDVVPLERPAGLPEIALTQVRAPARVGQGERFTVDVGVKSTISTAARLQVLAGDRLVADETVQLQPGNNNFAIPLQATAQEFARYAVQISAAEDTVLQNNQLGAFTEVTGPPRVLLIAADGTADAQGEVRPDEAGQLELALEATGVAVERTTPAGLSSSLEELANYASVVLVNVNAKNLAPRKMAALQTYVRDLGGGLVAVGGPESFGMGGYFRTPLEETLPVEMQIKDQERFPSVSMALVIDRSGSMALQEGSLTKIQLAAEAAVRVVELLNDFDEITVLPVDTAPDNPIGPASVAEREALIGRIRQIGAGGGGIYVRTGLEAAAEALRQSENQVKHVIVLADGSDSEQKEGVPELIEALAAEGVTISTVSIGEGPDTPWLEEMAELGGGRFHLTNEAANLPQIFTQETTAIQRSYLVEERFFPALGDAGFARSHAIFQAMQRSGITRVPALYGYVGATAKATAQTILTTHLGDPLLATWEYGLGRAAAWTSDATGRWGVDWVRWDGFPTFWSNVVRWTIAAGRDSNLQSEVTYGGEEARLAVDARTGEGAYLNDLALQANVVSPAGETVTLALAQVAPGRYEGTFQPQEEGAYFLRVTGSGGEGETGVGLTSGWVLGYSPEYHQLAANPQLLRSLAEITGGRVLPAEESEVAAAVFNRDLRGGRAARPIWPVLLTLAVVLLPLDVAVRRLALTRRDLEKAWAASIGRRRPAPLEVGRREGVARLFEAKERAGRRRPQAEGGPAPPAEIVTGDESARPAGEEVRPARPAGEAAEPDTSLASRLLEKKRQREKGARDE